MSASSVSSPPATSIGKRLECARLRHREERLSHVVRALEARDRLYAARGEERPPLRAAVRGFRIELARVRGRLRDTDRR